MGIYIYVYIYTYIYIHTHAHIYIYIFLLHQRPNGLKQNFQTMRRKYRVMPTSFILKSEKIFYTKHKKYNSWRDKLIYLITSIFENLFLAKYTTNKVKEIRNNMRKVLRVWDLYLYMYLYIHIHIGLYMYLYIQTHTCICI